MTDLKIQALERKFINKKIPLLRPGYLVRVHQKIKEGEKERVQIFEGLVICVNSGLGTSKTVTVRKIVEGIGVEKIFPLSSPNVVKIEVKKTFGVRRAKLFYLRAAEGLSNRLKARLGMVEEDAKIMKADELAHADEVEKDEPAAKVAATEAAPEAPAEEAPTEEAKAA